MSSVFDVLLAVAAVGGLSALCLWGAARLRPEVVLDPEEQAELAAAIAERQRQEREARRRR